LTFRTQLFHHWADKEDLQGVATEIVTEEMTDFSLKVHGHKHVFQAASKPERDGWLKAVETAAAEGKAAHEGITGSEGYKSHLASFG